MKRTVVLVLMLVSAVALFANGAGEVEREPVWNPVEVTGTVSIVDGFAVLTANGKTYLLGAPRAAWYVDDLEEGQTITIRGQLVEEPRADVDVDVDAHIAVDQAVVDGETYRLGRMGAMPGSRFAGRGQTPARPGMRGPDDRFGDARPYCDECDDELGYGRPQSRVPRSGFRGRR